MRECLMVAHGLLQIAIAISFYSSMAALWLHLLACAVKAACLSPAKPLKSVTDDPRVGWICGLTCAF
jgi:hypothetical protein